MNIKNQTWCGHDIRFVEKDGDWYAILKDVCDALDLRTDAVGRHLIEYYQEDDPTNSGVVESDDKTAQKECIGSTNTLKSDNKLSKKDEVIAKTLDGEPILAKTTLKDSKGRNNHALIISELGIYDVIFRSRKKEVRQFKEWIYKVIRELRQASELESYEAFRMTDKEIQKAANDRLYKTTHPESRVPVIKANTIANYATSKKHGQSKTLKKGEMTRDMLEDRQAIYDDTINLMIAQKAFDLDISISKLVYEKYLGKE